MPFFPYKLEFPPGFQRDGTQMDSPCYLEGQWTRFQRGKPRKIGGYRALSQVMTGVSRGLHMQTLSGYSYIHSGYAGGIEQVTVDSAGLASVPSSRTPGGFASNANNIWQMDSFYDVTSAKQQLLAFVVPALNDIAYGATTGVLYAGPIYTIAALTAVSGLATDATGGIVVLPPYTCVYGSNGLFQWSAPGLPLDFAAEGSGAARVTDQKLIRAYPLRAQDGYSPACVAWTMNGVIKVYFVGGAPVFDADPLTTESSILSHDIVVEGKDNIFYWAAQDRFMMTNGSSVSEVPNDKNLNFFFDNLNRAYIQKSFAFYNARWGEVWFCAPLFGATEPNWAVIYNDREKSWYDTQLPNGGRSAAVKNDLGAGAVMGGLQQYNGATYRLWQHERGTDEVDGNNTSAVPSSYTTGILTAANFQQPLDRAIKIDTLEPDFIQTGNMTVTALTRGNARAAFKTAQIQTFADTAALPADQQVPLKVTAKQIKLQFSSNVAGGNFESGQTLAFIEVDQARRTS